MLRRDKLVVARIAELRIGTGSVGATYVDGIIVHNYYLHDKETNKPLYISFSDRWN